MSYIYYAGLVFYPNHLLAKISVIHLTERSATSLLSSHVTQGKETLSSRVTSMLALRRWYFPKSVLGLCFLTSKKKKIR